MAESSASLAEPDLDKARTMQSAVSDKKCPELLECLEGFAERLKGRTNAVAEEVRRVLEEMDAVELNLQNTFNSFRCLSSSQYVEHHVYDEDETDLTSTGMSKKDAKQQLLMPTESYEDEILPRYKDAISFAWAAFQGGGRQDDHRSLRPGSRSKRRDSNRDERIQILPHVIGSEEFTRDIHCGLADLRRHDEPGSDTDEERDTAAGLAAEPIDTGVLSEGEMSGTDSDAFESQEESLEPAVSAALDFKAMLEAALRNPSLPYDGGTSNDSSFGEFADNKFSLPSLTDDYLNDSPRTISTMVDIIGRTMSTMDESKEELRDSASQHSNANADSSQPPVATEPPDVLDDPTPSRTFEELLKSSLTRAMLNQDFKQYIDYNNNDNGSRQVGAGDLSHLPIIPGGLFNDDDAAPDTGFPARENAVVPNSNTGPSIPEGLFQEQLLLSPKPIQRTRSKSQSSNSEGSSHHSLPLPSPSRLDIVPKSSSDQLSDSVLTTTSGKYGSNKFPSASSSSLIPKQAILEPVASSSASKSGSAVVPLGSSSQQVGLLPIRGGLFDDDDDEDDDDGDLFGTPAPMVDSQPVLRPWASRSSRGLFDDIAPERDDGTALFSDEAEEEESPREVPRNSDTISSLITSQYNKSQSGQGALDLSDQPMIDSQSAETHSGSTTHVDDIVVTSSGPEETVSKSESGDVKKEDLQLPIQSALAAAIRLSAPLVPESDDDDDSWSGGSDESGAENGSAGRIATEQRGREDASILGAENGERGAEGATILGAENSERGAEDGSILGAANSAILGAKNSESGAEDASILGAQKTSESGAEDGFRSGTIGAIVDFPAPPEVPVDSDDHHLAQSLSDAEEILTGAVHREEEESSVASSQTAPVVAPPRFPPATSRPFLSTGASPVKVPVNIVDNPLLSSKTPELSDAEASDSSDSSSSAADFQGVRERLSARNMLAGTSSPSENLRPSPSQPTGFVNESSLSQSSRENRISEDVSKVSSPGLAVPVTEVGRPATRIFTPLFDDDDAEEDLFFQGSSKRRGAPFFPQMGQLGIGLSSDGTLPISSGLGRSAETKSPLTIPDAHPQLPTVSNTKPSEIPVSSPPLSISKPSEIPVSLPALSNPKPSEIPVSLAPVSNPKPSGIPVSLQPVSNTKPSDVPVASRSSSFANKDGDLSAKSGLKLSSLLFGDDDEDDEDALFGPLGGRASRGLKSRKGGSLFGDANLPSTSSSSHPPKKGINLFDD